MFDEPSESPAERSADPKAEARDKADEFRMHAELFAVFEGTRKFEAALQPGLDPEVARDVQRTMARLAKSKSAQSPALPPASAEDAARLLALPQARGLSTNDYHLHQRPGEVMIIRCLQGDQVDTFYERLQAHFDAAMEGYKEEERQEQAWKQDAKTLAYLAALDAIDLRMSDWYARDAIRRDNLFVLSDRAIDDLNIAYVADYIMGATPADLVGRAAAPPDEPAERDLAWFFKLFSLRGTHDGVERMCFFAYLQKSDDESW